MKEKIENRVKIEDMDKNIFKEFLYFFYSGRIDETKIDLAIPLLAAADKYDVPGLKELCVNVLLRNLNAENALEVYSAAEVRIFFGFVCTIFIAIVMHYATKMWLIITTYSKMARIEVNCMYRKLLS